MFTRPPPLQLLLDNTRELRPEPQPGLVTQCSIFASRIYQANWRNLVIAVAAVNALRFLVAALTAFHDICTNPFPRLAQFSLALGALHLLTALIQIFGALSAALQRLPLIRAHVHLAFVAVLLIATTGFLSGLQYFLLAEDIIAECVALSVSGSWVSKSIFVRSYPPSPVHRGKLRPGQTPSTKLAQEQCLTAWSRGSLSQLAAVPLFSLLPALTFFLLAYAYYRQASDPAHAASLVKLQTGEMGEREGYGYSLMYGAGAGVGQEVGQHRAPRIQAQRQLHPSRSPLMHTASPSLSPGPPSYAAPALREGYGYGNGYGYGYGYGGDDAGRFV
ncbi:hypothetical protein D9615_009504 [Tricholomella constricta]|uniref:Transmembrane protein n=1 Tax=Tricholomella constricta TaxID=117010 RepID=A0A8H5GY93_9AGAR|nr:hypothetical protein D9615_009504 [Tricholomella constricta]